jgi:hypothetical protein
MTGDPGDVPPLARVVMHDVHQHGYRAYPLADHVADKACAIFERHGPTGTPSTRYKDLVDLVAIVLSAPVEAEPHSTSRTSNGPANLATIRAAVIAAIKDAGYLHVPEGRRDHTTPAETLRLHDLN